MNSMSVWQREIARVGIVQAKASEWDEILVEGRVKATGKSRMSREKLEGTVHEKKSFEKTIISANIVDRKFHSWKKAND